MPSPLEEAREKLLKEMGHPWSCIVVRGETRGHENCAPLEALAEHEAAAKAEAVIEQTKIMLLSGECPTCHHNVIAEAHHALSTEERTDD